MLQHACLAMGALRCITDYQVVVVDPLVYEDHVDQQTSFLLHIKIGHVQLHKIVAHPPLLPNGSASQPECYRSATRACLACLPTV
jgi:hypothetical protein